MFKYIKKFNKEIKNIKNIKDIKKIKIKYLNKNKYIKKLTKIIKNYPKKKIPILGKKINNIKKYIIKKIKLYEKKIYIKNIKNKNNNNINYIDISLPGKIPIIGNIHPITYILNKIENFFFELGFKYIENYEIENKKYNFDLLNIKKYHPSRSLKDTF